MPWQEAEEADHLVCPQVAVGTKMTGFDALMHQAGQRARGYWLLSRLFLEVPTEPMLRELRQVLADPDEVVMTPEVSALGDAIDASLAEPDSAAIAYTRHLSLGDRKAGEPLPFEAHVREGRLPGDNTQQVAAMMHIAGYADIAPEASSPDHLGAELRFMALLCHREHEAWSARDQSDAKKSLQLQRDLLTLHLAQWAPEYCRGLATRTTNGYLGTVARLVAASIDGDVEVLDDICRWIVPEDIAALS